MINAFCWKKSELIHFTFQASEGAIVDELCPMGHTISEQELRTKAKILVKLLKKMDNERKCK